jgi:hypothetical protein
MGLACLGTVELESQDPMVTLLGSKVNLRYRKRFNNSMYHSLYFTTVTHSG